MLADLGCAHTPLITVMNKCDRVPALYDLPTVGSTVHISAVTGEGIPALLAAMENALQKTVTRATVCIPFAEGHLLAKIRENGQVLSEEFLPEGTKAEIVVDTAMLEQLREYLL